MPEWLIGLLAQVRGATPVLAFATMLATSFLMFAPTEWLSRLSLSDIATDARQTIGLAFLASSALFIAQTASASIRVGRNAWLAWRAKQADGRKRDEERESKENIRSAREKVLHSLTPDEKACLSPFILEERTSVRFQIEDGISAGLVRRGVLYRATNIGDLLTGFDLNLQPWAREYLHDHPDLLAGASVATTSTPDYDMSRIRSRY